MGRFMVQVWERQGYSRNSVTTFIGTTMIERFETTQCDTSTRIAVGLRSTTREDCFLDCRAQKRRVWVWEVRCRQPERLHLMWQTLFEH